MGYMRHNMILSVINGDMDGGGELTGKVVRFRQLLPQEWQHLLIGPIPGVRNAYVSFVFLPDGGKEGWEASDEGDNYRRRFLNLFPLNEEGNADVLIVHARFGGDEAFTELCHQAEPELIVASNLHAAEVLLLPYDRGGDYPEASHAVGNTTVERVVNPEQPTALAAWEQEILNDCYEEDLIALRERILAMTSSAFTIESVKAIIEQSIAIEGRYRGGR